MFKKGSLSLSINAIVVLILAVTMLGLGLLFMQNMMGGAMGQLGDVADTVRDQMIEQIRSSGERLSFSANDFFIQRSGTQEFYYGILNQEQDQETFHLYFGCDTMMGETDPNLEKINEFVTFDYFPMTTPLDRNAVDVQKVIVRVSPQATTTTYRCAVFVGTGASVVAGVDRTPGDAEENFEDLTDKDNTADIYARRYFFVSVS